MQDESLKVKVAPSAERKDLLPLVALVAMTLWFCHEIVFSGKIPFFRDLATYFYPIKFSVAESFKAGELPLWDRHMATGFPIIAEFQSAVFYPPSISFYLLPFFAALRFTFVFHYALAASGAYILLRSWKLPAWVALIGAVLFAFGGTTVSLTNLLNHFQSAVWLPWIIFFWERALTSRRIKNTIVFACAALCQLLAGSPEIFLLSLGLVTLDTLRLRCEDQIQNVFHAGLVLLVAGLIIAGLGMVQLLPTAELAMQSRRDQAIPMGEVLAWSLQPSSLIGLLLPTLEADSSLSVGVRLLLTDGVPFLLSHYIGVFGVLGIFCWFWTARTKERAIIITLLGFSLVLAFGSHTPVYPLLYDWAPPLRILRFPEKYFYITFVLLIFAILRGVCRLADGDKSRTPWMIASVIFVSWLAVYLAFRSHPLWIVRVLHPARPSMMEVNPTTLATILVVLEKQIAVSLALLALLFLQWRDLLRPVLFQCLLISTVFFDLSSANQPLHFLRDEKLIQSVPRVIEKPPADPVRLFYYPPGNNLHPALMRVIGNPTYEKATEIAFNNLLPNAGLLYGFDYFQDIDALGRRSYTDLLNFINDLPADRRGKLLGALNVKYVVAFHDLDVKGLKLLREFPEHYSRMYEVSESLPRAYLVGRAIYDVDPINTLRRLVSDEFDPRREVVLNAPTPQAREGLFGGEAQITHYGNQDVQIQARLDQPGVLVLTDAFYPGWKVFVDGKEQTVLRANYLFRAVELRAGNHRVEFVYDPLSFKIGWIISLLTALVIISISLASLVRRKKQCRQSTDTISTEPVHAIVD